MASSRYLMTVFVAFVALFAMWSAYAASEFGRYTRNGYTGCSYVEKKVELAPAIASPKLEVIAGSSAAAGIDVATLTRAMKLRGFNFALAATFSPGYQLFQARKTLRPGDAALLAFEYLAYEYQGPTNALVDTVYSCGADYWHSLDWPRRLFFIFAIRPQRIFSTLSFNREATAARTADVLAKTIRPNGDLGDPLETAAPDANTHEPLVIRFRRESIGVKEIADFVAWAKANDVTVFATWPNTLYFKQYDSHPAFAEIASFYRSLGVEVIGEPEDAMVTSEFLADSIYHLTAPGIAKRTAKLIENLRSSAAFAAWRERASVSE